MTAPLVVVTNLETHFPIRRGLLRRQVGAVRAVDGVSFTIDKGRTLGLVGESGCGKTTVGRSVLRLVEPTRGEVRFAGQDVRATHGAALRALRRRMQVAGMDTRGVEPWAFLIVGGVQQATHSWMSNPRMSTDDLIDYLTMLCWSALCGIVEVGGSLEAFNAQPHPSPRLPTPILPAASS